MTQKSEVKLEPIDLTAEEDNQEPIDLRAIPDKESCPENQRTGRV